MRVLIGCEESQEVCKAFRALGHEAYSCDFKPCSGGHPEWHYRFDVRHVLLLGWDFFGCHPVCKYLTNSGVGWLARVKPTAGFTWSDKYQRYINQERYDKMVQGALFFNEMLDGLEEVGAGYVENPIMHKYAREIITRPYTQIIQPHQFGHKESKATCLWVVGRDPLEPTNDVYDEMMKLPDNERQRLHYLPPSKNRDELRSKTYPGIAAAMAEQWGNLKG